MADGLHHGYPLFRILLQHLLEQLQRLLAHLGSEFGHVEVNVRFDVLVHDFVVGVSVEGDFPDEDDVENDSQAVDIDFAVVGLVVQHLGRHEPRSAAPGK